MPRTLIYLKEWREYRELTQDRLAERLGTSGATISRWEAGKQKWTSDRLEEFAAALGCDPVDLFRNPLEPDYQAWRILHSMKPEMQRQAFKVLEALASEGDQAA